MPRWRGQQEHVYWGQCMRCGRRMPLGIMRWQFGLLVCSWSDCIDTAVVGSRDLEVARQVAIDRHELVPDPKLTHVPDPAADLNDVPFDHEH